MLNSVRSTVITDHPRTSVCEVSLLISADGLMIRVARPRLASRSRVQDVQDIKQGQIMQVRTAHADEIDAIAKVWYDAWQDGHAKVLPEELARDRTEESFRSRLPAMLPDIRVIGPPGAPFGFCSIKADELYQLFVSAAARGTGAASLLLADGEARLAANGVAIAWLACAIGNDRAARFYEKCGWHRARVFTSHLETANGAFDLDVWRYEKPLTRPA